MRTLRAAALFAACAALLAPMASPALAAAATVQGSTTTSVPTGTTDGAARGLTQAINSASETVREDDHMETIEALPAVVIKAPSVVSAALQQASLQPDPLTPTSTEDKAPQALGSAGPTPAVANREDGGLKDGVSIPDDLALDLSDIPGGKKALLCLALNDYFEARGESLAGRVAVAKVVLNRAQDLRFPNTVCGVVFESHRMTATNERVCQFSWHCDGLSDRPADTDVWRDSILIAAAVLFGGDAIEDPSGGAMWYHTTAVRPPWATQLQASAEIGAHLFYQDPNGNRPVNGQLASVVQNLPSVDGTASSESGD